MTDKHNIPEDVQEEKPKGFRLGARSLERLSAVHPDLQRVMHEAIKRSPVDFSISQGKRSRGEQEKLYAQGRTREELDRAGLHHVTAIPGQKVTWSLKSRHITGHAVDVAALPHGVLSWNESFYKQIAIAVKEAASDLGIQVAWGGDWQKTKDMPHFELDSKAYPAA